MNYDSIALITGLFRPQKYCILFLLVLYMVYLLYYHLVLQEGTMSCSQSALPTAGHHCQHDSHRWANLTNMCCSRPAVANAPQMCDTDDQQPVSSGSTLLLTEMRHCKSCAAASQQWQHVDPHRYEALPTMCCS